MEFNYPKLIKYPIFQKNIFNDEISEETFRMLYCEAWNNRYRRYKRSQAAENKGLIVPEDILPNTKLTVREIVEIMASSLN